MTIKPTSSYFWSAVTVSALVLASWPAAAQEADSPAGEQTSISGHKTKSKKKTTKSHTNGKSAKSADKKTKARQFASEEEAQAKCGGSVIWMDQDHLNHYKGSREYGVKPGAFACEQ